MNNNRALKESIQAVASVRSKLIIEFNRALRTGQSIGISGVQYQSLIREINRTEADLMLINLSVDGAKVLMKLNLELLRVKIRFIINPYVPEQKKDGFIPKLFGMNKTIVK